MKNITKPYIQNKQIENFVNIKRVNHLNELKLLNLPKDQFVIVSSGVMSLFGIRENDDIDISVTKKLFWYVLKQSKFHMQFYKKADENSFFPSNYPICRFFDGSVEIGFRTFTAPIQNLIDSAYNIDGYNFLNFERLIQWKLAINRPKDINDIKLIQNFCNKHNIQISPVKKLLSSKYNKIF